MTDKFSHHIATLLRRHDCVIVPGLGAFVATREAAAFADEVLTPPRRVVSFNPALTHDDGLLAGSVARRTKISFEQARERVGAEAALIQRRLKAEGAVEIPRVGALQRLSGGRLEFIPDAPWTLSLPAVALAKPAPAFEVVKPAPEEETVAVVRVPLRIHWLRAAAVAIAVCLLGFVLSTPIDIDTAQHASLAAPAFTPPEEPRFEPLPEPEGLELNIAMAPEPAAVAAPQAPMNYVVVVASLPTLAKAEEYISETDASLQILHSDGRYRVYAAEGATADDALAAARRSEGFAARYPDAWVCRR